MPHCNGTVCRESLDEDGCACTCDPCRGAPEVEAVPTLGGAHAADRKANSALLWTVGAVIVAVALAWHYSQSQKPNANASAPSSAPAEATAGAREEAQRSDQRPAATVDVRSPEAIAQAIDERTAKLDLANVVGGLHAMMTDTVGDQLGDADLALARWGSSRMRWQELQLIEETKLGLVMKDPAKERGRRVCVSGSLVQIAAVHGATFTYYEGIMLAEDGGTLRFLAVGDTGELVAHSDARFCGVVTGTNTYTTNAGGSNQAVLAIGMFDLPTNRAKLGK